jgi:hypothetical protein
VQIQRQSSCSQRSCIHFQRRKTFINADFQQWQDKTFLEGNASSAYISRHQKRKMKLQGVKWVSCATSWWSFCRWCEAEATAGLTYQNSSDFKGLNKAALSMIWQPNKSWATMIPSADNIKGYLLSLSASRCAKYNLNKTVLITGSAPGHPVNFLDYAHVWFDSQHHNAVYESWCL